MMIKYILCFTLLLCSCAQVQNKHKPLANVNEFTDNDILVVVVHEENPIDNISSNRLKLFYKALILYWPNGREIVRVHFPSGTKERESFSYKIFNKDSAKMLEYWIISQQIGKPFDAPINIASGRRVLGYLNGKLDGIGYVRLKDYKFLKEKKGYKVKIITVDGVDPTIDNAEKGKYPLILYDINDVEAIDLFYQ